MTSGEIESTHHFLKAAGMLKDQLRQSWTQSGRRESVAEHSWRLALMAMLLSPEEPGLDPMRVLELCLVHDLGEALNGDLPAPDQADKARKTAQERDDLAEIASHAPERFRDRVVELWEEYEAGETREAAFVKGLDKIETILQHLEGDSGEEPEIDFDFNLGYGRDWTDRSPLLRAFRDPLDARTFARSRGRS